MRTKEQPQTIGLNSRNHSRPAKTDDASRFAGKPFDELLDDVHRGGLRAGNQAVGDGMTNKYQEELAAKLPATGKKPGKETAQTPIMLDEPKEAKPTDFKM